MKSITMKDTVARDGRVFTAGQDYKIVLVPPAKEDEILGGLAEVLVRHVHAEESGTKKTADRPKGHGA
jgi:hypothetical protein